MTLPFFSRETALRIGLAARVLPDTDTKRLMNVLIETLGLPLTDAKLDSITVKALKNAAEGEFAEVDPAHLQEAVHYLKGHKTLAVDDTAEAALPQPYHDGDLPDSIRVAFASNGGMQQLDSHFGNCRQFLIYQISKDEAHLIEVRPVVIPDSPISDERTAARARFVADCHILYVVSIGGPPAAKVVNAGVHPMKRPEGGPIDALIHELQQVLRGTPPPWLAKLTGAKLRPELSALVGEDGC